MKLRTVMLLLVVLFVPKVRAQDPLDGLWQGYDGEWRHVSNQLIAQPKPRPLTSSHGVQHRVCAPPAKSTCTSS